MNMDAGLSALSAFGVAQQVTANNIVNADTEEFRASRVVMEERPDMGGVRVQDISPTSAQGSPVEVIRPVMGQSGVMEQASALVQSSTTDLATQMVNLMANQRAFEANAAAVRVQDQMIGTLLDEMA